MIELVGPDLDVARAVGTALLYGGLAGCAVLAAVAVYDWWRGDH